MEQDTPIANGAKRSINGQWRVYFDGYWIKAYDAPADTLAAKKKLIEALTRRLFNHVEHGLNIPGTRLEEARRAFEIEADPDKKRVKGAMLAGALFNRAADVFTKAVEIQALGIEIRADNALVRECGEYLQEALTLGRMVLHCSGEEGIDEMWGEPFKAFAFPIEEFYRNRYLKIAQAMRDIDRIAAEIVAVFGGTAMFGAAETLVRELADGAKIKCETLHTDGEIFDVWAGFVVACERLSAFEPRLGDAPSADDRQRASDGRRLLVAGKDLIFHITRARVPMPKSTREYLEKLATFRVRAAPAQPARASVRPSGDPPIEAAVQP